MRAIATRELVRLRYTDAWKLDGEKISWAGGRLLPYSEEAGASSGPRGPGLSATGQRRFS